ncbi:beta-glucosidase BglX [Polaribacter haliotis]|uniref:beta-glucosidase n=1 Tax=Polaribacter haliotis TaxID=1888915 RepID=A0A7L8ADY1_9FLAO|nr:beta-glucosidase BglX [Polaribacter haliotis]QOD60223.1 beta-glucosidase BglX [Polaribacter haliotis]
MTRKLFISTCIISIFFLFSCNKKKNTKDSIIEDLLAKMTIEEKVGQLNLIPFGQFYPKDTVYKWIKEGKVGSILKSNGAKTNLEVQKVAVEESRLGIPILFQEDVIHGYKTIAPIPLAEAASWDLPAIRNSAAIAAREASAAGLHLTYAPMVDIAQEARWGRILEGAGEDPYLGSLIATARVKGFQESNGKHQNLLATVKHYAGYGASLAGRDYNIQNFSERELRELHLPPFKAAINAGVSSVMSAYTAYDGVPVVANKYLMNTILREELKFDGLLMTDWMTITNLVASGIAKNDTIAVKMAIETGHDMDMSSKVYLKILPSLIKNGTISEKQLNDRVRKVLRLKEKAGLFENPYAFFDEKREKDELMSPKNLKETREMAAKSMVLLKNENNTLPLSKNQKIAIIGPFAKSQKDLLGWWSAKGEAKDVVSIFDGIKAQMNNNKISYAQGCIVENFEIKGEEMIAEAVALAKKSDVVVLALGEKEWMSGEGGGVASLLLPGAQQKLLDALSKTKTPIVSVIITGRPYVLTDVAKKSSALLQAWMPGTTGGNAVADILFGVVNPTGKLPVSFPYHQGQVPIFYNYKRTSHSFNAGTGNNRYSTTHRDIQTEPLYPFGYGLSYTNYKYKNIRLDKKLMSINDSVKVSIDITNTGDRNGEEIIQLYIFDKFCSVMRPFKELKDFKKVAFKSKETKTIDFYVTKEKLQFIGINNKETIEKGDFEVMIGPNSSELQKVTFTLK